MSVNIRKGEQRDLESVFNLVQELAMYEKAPEEVTATLDDYYENYKDEIFDFIVAEVEQSIVGISLFYYSYSTWKGKMLFLEDFVVREELRGKGIGQLLFDATVDHAKDTECKLMKWEVLDWNEPAIQFYQKNNAVIEKNWWDGKLFF
ncbi:GNAT family N-acetyltransferase [Membranihabitans maritimus]|uniref:GNAT family N-acetyltransferase n=1 Tax=Membranihabitans maritimus TaxID=2904244 RepID=UPI001F45A687|nr:GNAT family N-acetyltransferase [Membranihabitans maritimus]